MPTVRLLPADVATEVPRGTRLVDAIRSAGLPIAAPCADTLICAKCAVRVLEGRVRDAAPVEQLARERNQVAPTHRLACAVRVHSDLVVTADYWGPLARASVEDPPPAAQDSGSRSDADSDRLGARGARRALVIVDHGSRRPEAHAHLEALAAQIRAQRPSLRLYVAHMELAEPSLPQTLACCVRDGAREIDVLPLFLAPGRHVTRDLPALVAGAREEYPELGLRLLEPIGERPEFATWILGLLAPLDDDPTSA